MTFMSSSVNILGMYFFLSSPMPCSPVSDPPCDTQAVLPGELGDPAKDRRELRARDDAVLDVVVVGDAAHSTESGLASLPEEGAFVVILGHPDLRGLVLLADLQHPSELFLYLSFRSIQLDNEHRAGIGHAWM